MTYMKFTNPGPLFVAALALLFAAPLHAADPYRVWNWQMPGELYKQLNHIQRSQFDKAGKLFDQALQIDRHPHTRNQPDRRTEMMRYYKTSALEWQKIRVQTGDTLSDSALAYVIFMTAHSHHRSLNRQQALRTYTEVIDYFPNEIWITVPALYFKAEAHFENGDDLQGYKALQAIAKDTGYLRHPLAAGALRRLADNQWANQQFDRAIATWKTAWESYRKANHAEASQAADKLRDAYLVRGKFAELNRFLPQLVELKHPNRPITLCDVYTSTLQMARRGLDRNHGWAEWYYKRFHNDSKAAALMDESRQAIYDWFTSQKNIFSQKKRLWDYYSALLGFCVEEKVGKPQPLIDELVKEYARVQEDINLAMTRGRELINDLAGYGERDQASRIFQSLSGIIRSSRVPENQKEKHAGELIGTLAHRGMIEEGLSLLDLYTDASRAFWAEFSLYYYAGDWPKALASLDKLEKLKQAKDLRNIRARRAEIYHNRTGEYDKAVEVYRQIAEPPGTLWSIQDCQRRAGRTDQAINTLTEIASMFPDQAARAVFTKAEYYRTDGKHKLAVSLYRQILQRFRKSQQSSLAHQRLEDYGIATGGGVVNELD